jgi:hypothetical protein
MKGTPTFRHPARRLGLNPVEPFGQKRYAVVGRDAVKFSRP